MVEIGYNLSSEEHPPKALVRYATQAEASGFSFAVLSDHFHPWLDRQGNSPFAWSVLGAIAQATDRLRFGTGVTCPTIRYHPAIVAQAAATVTMLSDNRFFLGLGTGENLNEHVVGAPWPPAGTRRAMLAEAIQITRRLWSGDWVSHDGDYYTVEQARIYSLPDPPPPIYVAASGSRSAELAGELSDGLISVAPQADLAQKFERAGGTGKPRYGKLTVCWAANEDQARRTAHEWWRSAAVPGQLSSLLPTPRYFEQAASLVSEDDVAKVILTSPDPAQHLKRLREYADAGYDHIYVHQVGPEQGRFFDFYSREILPRVGELTPAVHGASAPAS